MTKTEDMLQNRWLKQLLVCLPPQLGDENVGHRVAGLRLTRQMALSELAFLGCSAATLSRLENGRNNVIDFRMLVGLSLRLRANPLYLAWGFAPTYLEPEAQVVLEQLSLADDETIGNLQRGVLQRLFPSLR